MTIFEVRCCCDPDKLLGYLPCWLPPEALPPPGGFVRFPVKRVEVIRFPFSATVSVDTIELEISWYRRGHDKHLAYKSNDYPLETLRRIRGWMDATPEEPE